MDVHDIHDGPITRQASATLTIHTSGRGLFDITAQIHAWIERKRFADGLLTTFCRHMSCSLTIQENANPDVRHDLLSAPERLAPRDFDYRHHFEGPDDIPAHIKTVLTGSSLTIPVSGGKPVLGVSQAVYFIEHRDYTHRRNVMLQFTGC